MKRVQVIPAMDLIGGNCVRLKGGDFSQQTKYSSDPIEVARQFELAGFKRLHMVDLDGAKAGSPKNLDILEKVSATTSLTIDYSGGIKIDKDIESAFEKGASMVAIGSVAVKNKMLFFKWLEKYGSEKIILGVDVRDEKLAISGWLEQTEINILGFLKEMTLHGITQLFCTDISKDGMMSGPSIELYKKINSHFPEIKIIASGGISNPDQLADLNRAGCTEAIVGKAIYEDFQNLSKWLI